VHCKSGEAAKKKGIALYSNKERGEKPRTAQKRRGPSIAFAGKKKQY